MTLEATRWANNGNRVSRGHGVSESRQVDPPRPDRRIGQLGCLLPGSVRLGDSTDFEHIAHLRHPVLPCPCAEHFRDSDLVAEAEGRIPPYPPVGNGVPFRHPSRRSEEHTSELQSQFHLVCRLLLEKKK